MDTQNLPLLITQQQQQQEHHQTQPSTANTEQQQQQPNSKLNKSIQRLETFLRILGFFHDTPLSLSLSTLTFLLMCVISPTLVILIFYCHPSSSSSKNCDNFHVKYFELEILICEVSLAAVSLCCVSWNLRKYGLKRFLFVDKYDQLGLFEEQYVSKIDGFFRSLAIWILPCLILKATREISRVIYVGNNSLAQSVLSVLLLLVSWTYSAGIYLSGSMLFSLICNLQVIHFENYRKLFERDFDVLVYMEEHIRLTFHLSKISHRFRIFLILEFLLVTTSQFIALLETTGSQERITFINAAAFVISSIVQVVGVIICLHAAAKISHRAQSLASCASRWHALVTGNANDNPPATSQNNGNSVAASTVVPVFSYSESDLESSDYVSPPTNMELVSYMSSYHKREAFVMYMQSNPGGLTIFGFTVDRTFMNTIFFIELSVVTFVLGKTISFTTSEP